MQLGFWFSFVMKLDRRSFRRSLRGEYLVRSKESGESEKSYG